jgi:uncharacterized protein YdhG (YjbR/CyaY superfamily)
MIKKSVRKARPATVAEYIEAAAREARPKLRSMRSTIRKAAPGATEGLKWGMPAVSYRRVLVVYAAFRNHIGFYPTPSAIKAFAKELKPYKSASGSVQFPLDEPLPLALVRRITQLRARESREKDAKWKTP